MKHSGVLLHRSRMRGNAIIAALLVVALVATIGGKLLMTQETWITQMNARLALDTSRETVLASLHWARSALADDALRSKEDHAGEAWAQPMPVIDQDGLLITGRIEDEQAKFDLNSMVLEGKQNAPAIATFSRLLTSLNLPATLASALVDWIDADDEASAAGGAESAYYSARSPAYRTPNTSIGSLDELLYVRGFDASTIHTLKPFVTALPTPMSINVNTASAEVLSAALPKLPLEAGRQVVVARRTRHFTSVEDFTERLPADMRENIQNVGVQSQFFIAHGEARAESNGESTVYRISTLLQRQEKKLPLVIWQKPG